MILMFRRVETRSELKGIECFSFAYIFKLLLYLITWSKPLKKRLVGDLMIQIARYSHILPVEQQVAAIIDELKITDRAYFGKDRVKVIKAKIDEAVVLLDTKPIDMGK
jgi:hypothetical protein